MPKSKIVTVKESSLYLFSTLTKHPVPDYEHPGVVLVDTVAVAAVVDAVMAGGVQDPLERAQARHALVNTRGGCRINRLPVSIGGP